MFKRYLLQEEKEESLQKQNMILQGLLKRIIIYRLTRWTNLLMQAELAAKVDNSAVQDGYSLYHHVILFDERGNWTIVQQGMNPNNKMARRYHWISEHLKSLLCLNHMQELSANVKVLTFLI